MKQTVLLILFILMNQVAFGQLSPPGLGKANTVSWYALGVRQKLDTLSDRGWQSITYVGFGRKSNPDNYNPFYYPAIFVLNQEFYNQFRNHWQYSLALSYRRQDYVYSDNPPYELENPKLQQEFRIYGRFSYIFKTSRIKITPTFRQEFRKFYTPDFKNMDENFQLRSRFRLQLSVNLNKNKTHKLIVNSEQLFSISKEIQPSGWTDFGYRESRFSLYYSISSKTLPLTFNIGYMNNLVGYKTIYDAHYLAFDIIIENPLKLLRYQSKLDK